MSPSIKKFIIKGLFGRKDIELDFQNKVQIYVGENGLGKTTILNTLYYVLSCNFEKLAKISFDTIEVHFKKDTIKFTKDEIQNINPYGRRGIDGLVSLLCNRLTLDDIEKIKKIYNKATNLPERWSEIKKIESVKALQKSRSIPLRRLLYAFDDVVESSLVKVEFLKNKIQKNIKSKILYFPTYRRIEEELENLNLMESMKDHDFSESFPYDDDERLGADENSLIQFGMVDIEKRIKSITEEISRSSVSGFSKLTGDMLVQLLRGFPDVTGIEKINKEDITIILNRVGDNLTQEDKNKIIELINNNEIFKTKNKQLIYFLQKLLELYKSQSLYDTAIKDFTTVCNGYLNDKQYEYNESTVDLRIFRNDNEKKDELVLSHLSSGEKQIVSLFSKIYLEPKDTFIVLFDEPELSLSIFWQKKLLPDIIKSKRCDFLLAVTHSPFIFENELLNNTVGLKEFFKK